MTERSLRFNVVGPCRLPFLTKRALFFFPTRLFSYLVGLVFFAALTVTTFRGGIPLLFSRTLQSTKVHLPVISLMQGLQPITAALRLDRSLRNLNMAP